MDPTLYILMRNDMDSLNPGKGMAQAAHAANHFTATIESYSEFQDEFNEWEKSTAQNFGRTIVLAVSSEELLKMTDAAGKAHLLYGLIIDPTYPLQDGDTTHLLSLMTCGWIFMNADEAILEGSPVYGLPLYK